MGPSIANKFHYYDEVRSPKNLHVAWRKVYSNGIRSQSIETRNSVKEFSDNYLQNIDRIYRKLLRNDFIFQPATGIPINRPKKSPRPIVMAPISNRIVQRSILDVLQKDNSIQTYVNTPFSFGGLKEKSVYCAIGVVQKKMLDGAKWYIQSDIKDFFTQIPKKKVIEFVSRFIPDEKFVALFTSAINTELENMDRLGQKANLFPIYEIGVAQGCCLSPLIGNIVLHYFDEVMNRDGVYCIRYIDDFIVLAPTRKKALAAFKSGLQILKDEGLSAYHPLENKSKARIGQSVDCIDFLGCEIVGLTIRPNKKSRERLLSKIDNVIGESKKSMKNPVECIEKKRSYVDTLKSINNTLEGWGNHYFFCNDQNSMINLDQSINIRLRNYFDYYKYCIKSYGLEDYNNKRRLLGVYLLIDSFSKSNNKNKDKKKPKSKKCYVGTA